MKWRREIGPSDVWPSNILVPQPRRIKRRLPPDRRRWDYRTDGFLVKLATVLRPTLFK